MTFEKGSLLDLAADTNISLDREKKEVDDLFDLIKSKVKFNYSRPKIKLNDDKGDIVVDVNYAISDIKTIVDILNNKYGANIKYNSYSKPTHIMLCNGGYDACYMPYKGYGFTGINGDELGKYFISKRIELVLEAGSYRDSTKIAYCLHMRRTKYGTQWKYWIAIKTDTFYLKIKDIPKSDLSKIGEIKVSVAVIDEPPKEGRQDWN